MTNDRLGHYYRHALRARARERPAPDVPLEAIEALAAGRLSHDEAAALLDRVMADERLRQEFELLRSVHQARALKAPARRWLGTIALAATVVIAIGGLMRLRQHDDAPPRIRGGDGTAVVLVSPADGATMAPPVILSWRPVDGALRYGFDLLDGNGDVAFTGQTADTTFTLPAAAVQPGTRYRWVLTATTPRGVVSARPRSFSVSP